VKWAYEGRLLHYKYLGLDYLVERTSALRTRMREDRARGYGSHYLEPAEMKKSFETIWQAADLFPSYRPGVADNERRASLEGVRIVLLKRVTNERGYLTEVQRSEDAIHPGFGQAYVTATRPGIIKAWYRHRTQVDQIVLVKGAIKLVLFDEREGSSSYKQSRELLMDERVSMLVQIPPGVWHGFQAFGPEDAILLHLNSVPFNFDQPDEERVPPDDSRIPYRW
jgi:dTDP-4-dehydrorhamnose 3,5-epimerase